MEQTKPTSKAKLWTAGWEEDGKQFRENHLDELVPGRATLKGWKMQSNLFRSSVKMRQHLWTLFARKRYTEDHIYSILGLLK